MNKLYFNTLKANTSVPFELVIIDNNSNDGTREFFKKNAELVIENSANYTYPYCQNQGIKASTGEYLAFFNNDIVVSRDWSEHAIGIMEEKDVDVLSFATNDSLGDRSYQRKLNRRWKRIKYPLFYIMGVNKLSLKWALGLMYKNLNSFSQKRFKRYGFNLVEGFSGSCIMIRRSALDKIGLWDERIQAADFDLFNRVKERSLKSKDIAPVQLALGIYCHHYQRLTLKRSKTPFADGANIIPLDEKWGDKTAVYMKDIEV